MKGIASRLWYFSQFSGNVYNQGHFQHYLSQHDYVEETREAVDVEEEPIILVRLAGSRLLALSYTRDRDNLEVIR